MKSYQLTALAFFASVLLLATVALGQEVEYETRRSDIFTIQDDGCIVLQGGNLSFLDCPNTFEIYKTAEIAISPYEKTLYGQITAIESAHTTLEVAHNERITWLETPNKVMYAQAEDDGSISKVNLMKLYLLNGEVVQNLWVFDSFVVVKLTNGQIKFFEKPLLEAYTERDMSRKAINNITVYSDFDTVEFGRDETNSTRCFMYGVRDGAMYRYTYEVNLDNKSVVLTNALVVNNPYFDGIHYKSIVTLNYFIVSCSDCAQPQVALFDHQLRSVTNFTMGAPNNDTINLSAYESSRFMMQLFVAGRSQIDLIEMQMDTKDRVFFKKTDGLYVMEEPVNATLPHQISVGKGRNYLTFKLSSKPFLYLMATCQSDEFYDSKSFTCQKCRPAHHSFGLQEQLCYPCNSLWMASKNDALQYAIYDQKCTSGEYKSIGVIAGSIVIILTLGIICCCTNRMVAKRLRVAEKEGKKVERNFQKTQMAQKVGKALGLQARDEKNEFQLPVRNQTDEESRRPTAGFGPGESVPTEAALVEKKEGGSPVKKTEQKQPRAAETSAPPRQQQQRTAMDMSQHSSFNKRAITPPQKNSMMGRSRDYQAKIDSDDDDCEIHSGSHDISQNRANS